MKTRFRALERQLLNALRVVPGWSGFTFIIGPEGVTLRIYLTDAKFPAPFPRFQDIPVETAVLPSFRRQATSTTFAPASAQPLRPASRVSTTARDPESGALIPADPGLIAAFIQGTDSIWLLTANHVMARNGLLSHFKAEGDGVHAGNPPRRVSRERPRFIPIDPGLTALNEADAAICPLDADLQPDRPLYPPAWGMTVGVPQPAREGSTVRFLNRLGNEQTATVEVESGVFRVEMDLNGDVDAANFREQILIRGTGGPLVEPGDSGTLVVMDAEGGGATPLGVAFGFPSGGDDHSAVLVSPLKAILSHEEFSQATGGATSILL